MVKRWKQSEREAKSQQIRIIEAYFGIFKFTAVVSSVKTRDRLKRWVIVYNLYKGHFVWLM